MSQRTPIPPLFAPQPPSNGTRTSNEAAERIKPSAGTLRQLIFGYLLEHPGGLTDEQIQTKLGMNPSTQRPRRGELVDAGSVKDSGRTRKTISGREAVVWVAVKENK